MARFLKPTVVRIPLPSEDGDCIEVKKELTVGDQKRLEAAGMRRVRRELPGGGSFYQPEIDWEIFELARAEVWITDWFGPSFVNEDGTPMKFSFAALKAMTPTSFDEISDAISAHITTIAEEKKLKAQPSEETVEKLSTS